MCTAHLKWYSRICFEMFESFLHPCCWGFPLIALRRPKSLWINIWFIIWILQDYCITIFLCNKRIFSIYSCDCVPHNPVPAVLVLTPAISVYLVCLLSTSPPIKMQFEVLCICNYFPFIVTGEGKQVSLRVANVTCTDIFLAFNYHFYSYDCTWS